VKLEDIRDAALREWVTDYVAKKLTEAKKSAGKAEQLRSVWRRNTEAHWAAWRELMTLRPLARERFSQTEVDVAVQRRLASLPRTGAGYAAPYSYGLEVAALRELLGPQAEPPPPAPVKKPGRTAELDFGAPARSSFDD